MQFKCVHEEYGSALFVHNYNNETDLVFKGKKYFAEFSFCQTISKTIAQISGIK